MTFTMSFWLLVVIFTRLANFLVVEIDKLDLDASGFTTCCVVEMTSEYSRLVQELLLDSARSHGYFRMSTEQFDYVLGLVGPYISRVSVRAGTHDVVRRRTQCERRFRVRNSSLCVKRP